MVRETKYMQNIGKKEETEKEMGGERKGEGRKGKRRRKEKWRKMRRKEDMKGRGSVRAIKLV